MSAPFLQRAEIEKNETRSHVTLTQPTDPSYHVVIQFFDGATGRDERETLRFADEHDAHEAFVILVALLCRDQHD